MNQKVFYTIRDVASDGAGGGEGGVAVEDQTANDTTCLPLTYKNNQQQQKQPCNCCHISTRYGSGESTQKMMARPISTGSSRTHTPSRPARANSGSHKKYGGFVVTTAVCVTPQPLCRLPVTPYQRATFKMLVAHRRTRL